MHSFYNGVEKVFRRIAPELNGDVPAGAAWHRQLLEDMTLDLKEVRPPVLRETSARRLEKYLDFRHRFRNLYFFDLDWSLLEPLLGSLAVDWPRLREDLEAFVDWLRSVVAAIAGPE